MAYLSFSFYHGLPSADVRKSVRTNFFSLLESDRVSSQSHCCKISNLNSFPSIFRLAILKMVLVNINILIFSVKLSRLNLFLKGFFKHMYKYFVPDASLSELKITAQAPSVDLMRDLVPLYDEQGEFVLFFGVLFQP